MDRIGLIGGVGWMSTMEYYRRLNLIAQAAGHHGSAKLVMYSMNFGDILKVQQDNDEEGEFQILLRAALELERSGATKILICSNTATDTCDRLATHIAIPTINIIDATVAAAKRSGFKSFGLLGTRYVMERGIYIERFGREGLHIVLPRPAYREAVQDAFYDDSSLYNFPEKATKAVRAAIDDLIVQDVDAVILGGTELPLMRERMSPSPGIELIDSIDVHIAAALQADASIRAHEA